MIRGFCRWWSDRSRLRRMRAAERIALQWKRDALKALRGLGKSSHRLEAARKRFDKTYDVALGKLEAARKRFDKVHDDILMKLEAANDVIARHDHAEDALREELRLYREITVPGLTDKLEELQQWTRSNIAALVRQEVSLTPEQREVERYE